MPSSSAPVQAAPYAQRNQRGRVTHIQPIIDNFGKKPGDAGYTTKIDANGDGVIDELDLFVVGRKFGS